MCLQAHVPKMNVLSNIHGQTIIKPTKKFILWSQSRIFSEKTKGTITNKEQQWEAEDDTQTTGPDRPEGEKLREPEGENRLESIAFKP